MVQYNEDGSTKQVDVVLQFSTKTEPTEVFVYLDTMKIWNGWDWIEPETAEEFLDDLRHILQYAEGHQIKARARKAYEEDE